MFKSKFMILSLLLVMAAISVDAETLRERRQRLNFMRAFMSLDVCQRAVWSCCQSEQRLSFVPVNCFEGNGCFGLHWMGLEACSDRMLNRVAVDLHSAIQLANMPR